MTSVGHHRCGGDAYVCPVLTSRTAQGRWSSSTAGALRLL